MIRRDKLYKLYVKDKKSMQEIAEILGCSLHKVKYWMDKHGVKIRSISEAVYLKNNPFGDPFEIYEPKTVEEAKLFGLGVGLYWGEGTKADKCSVRLGNTDPELINRFVEFLIKFFNINKGDLRFGLQLFSDMDPAKALDFWRKKLRIKNSQFYKPTITKSRSLGTYRKKSKYGVMTAYYHNRKLRDVIVNMLPG